MFKVNTKNEHIKRRFFIWLKEAGGCCDSTIANIEKAILLYEDFTEQADFATFKAQKAIEFKKSLIKRRYRDKNISLTTYCTYLRHLRKFFIWLTSQTGYRSKITPDIVDYLKISEKEERIAMQSIPRSFPPLEYVLNLTGSIKINSEIDKRDRALIAFTLLSGMRDKAIATLPLGCFDETTLTISQNPRRGVETKFSKYIQTTLTKFNDTLFDYLMEWIKHLKNKGFSSQDPLFPRSKNEQGENNLSFETASEVEPVYWRGTGRIREIFKKRSEEASLPYFAPHTFRHLAFEQALKACKSGEHIKAISQNFGHEHIATTLSSYANYTPDRLSQIISNMDFSGKKPKDENSKLEAIKKLIDS
jgi:integrase